MPNPHHYSIYQPLLGCTSFSLNFRFISKLVDQIYHETLTRDRKERQIAPQASAGDSLSRNFPLDFRKAERAWEKKASEKEPNPPPPLRGDKCLMIASKMPFLPGP